MSQITMEDLNALLDRKLGDQSRNLTETLRKEISSEVSKQLDPAINRLTKRMDSMERRMSSRSGSGRSLSVSSCTSCDSLPVTNKGKPKQ